MYFLSKVRKKAQAVASTRNAKSIGLGTGGGVSPFVLSAELDPVGGEPQFFLYNLVAH